MCRWVYVVMGENAAVSTRVGMSASVGVSVSAEHGRR